MNRILLCSDHLPPNDGGVEQVVDILARRLDAHGYEVAVFTLAGDDLPALSTHDSIDLYVAETVDTTSLLGLQSTVSFDAFPTFRTALSEFDPDLVHVHNRFFYTSYVSGLVFGAVNDAPVVTTMHLGDIGAIDGIVGAVARSAEHTLGRLLLSRSDHVITVSDAVARHAARLGVPEEGLTVVRNAVEIDEFDHSPPAGKDIVYIGRLVRNNGPIEFLEAAALAHDEHPDAHFHLVGTGPLEGAVHDRIGELDIGESVTVHGFVDDIRTAYEWADVFCRPSYSEGLPLTVLEAMASGVPPVVSDIAGVPEVVEDGETGVLLPVGEVDQIAALLSSLLDDGESLEAMGERAREYAATELSWEHRVRKVISVYESLADS